MRLRKSLIALLVAVPVSFYAGYRAHIHVSAGKRGPDGRAILYYVDPMDPSYHSSQPGIAPCGMKLEPVYADSPPAGKGAVPGAIAVRPEGQQLIGVAVETAQRRTVEHRLRLLGRIAVDETRLYRIHSTTPGWVREVGPATTGSVVRKGDVLAAYYATEVAARQIGYLKALEAYEQVKASGPSRQDNVQGGDQAAAYEESIRAARLSLLNLGMPPEQLEEITATRKPAPLVQIRAPATGFVLARNVSLGQGFDGSTELYTIADLSRVWVLADAFESDARFFRPGMPTLVTRPGLGQAYTARVSRVLPQFDAATRTLKVRMEVDNPRYELRADMFVDVEMPVERGPAITVPKEAVLDSGTRRVVYVAGADGVFAPRRVETGWRHGDRVEIVSGLTEGEKVVTSGNFLLDSESRMRAAGAEQILEKHRAAHAKPRP
jgi:Cu(I)/Ag(I) efflux system membrane fusion protein